MGDITSLITIQLVLFMTPLVSGNTCDKTIGGGQYDFVVAVLISNDREDSLQTYIDAHIQSNDTSLKDCFAFTTIVSLNVKEQLKISQYGWTQVLKQTEKALLEQAYFKNGSGISSIVGPYYTNLAMMTERPEFSIPYIVTDYKGFDWVDENIVTTKVPWRSLVDIKPSPKEVNLAIVDLFKEMKWKTTFLIQPHDPMDNRECQDLMRQLIKEEISPIPNSLKMNGFDPKQIKSDAIQMLRTSQLLNIKVLLVCSPRDEEQQLINIILGAARDFHLLENKENTLVLLDTSFYYKPLQELNIYRGGLYGARAQILAYRYTTLGSNPEAMSSAKEAAAVDAAEIIKQAQKKYLTYIPPQSEYYTRLNRSIFLKALRSSSLPSGKTGFVMFDEIGSRKNYTLYLYQHGGGVELYNKIGTWSPGGSSYDTRLKILDDNETVNQNARGIFEGKVKVVVVLEEPFVMLKQNGHGPSNSDRFEGFTIDLLKALAKKLQMTYEIYQSPRNSYGAEDRNGKWDGIVGEVASGNATLGMGAISITSSREKVIDFSLGVITSGTNMLISKPRPKYTMFQFMKPFSVSLWMAIVGASVALSLLYLILDYSSEVRLFTVRETLWFSIGTLLQKGTDFSPRPASQRIITAGFLFFVLITVTTYTANLAAFLTRKSLEMPINSLQDLADRRNFEIGTIKNSATMAFLKKGEKAIHRTIWDRIVESKGLVSNSVEGRLRSGRGNYAFIFDYLINSYSEFTACDTKMVGIPFRLQEHGIAMRSGAPFKTRVNIALLQLKEEGKLKELQTKWWENKRTCNIEDDKGPNVEFTLNHMAGVFIVGGFGLACSVAFFLFKKFYLLARTSVDKTSNGAENISIDEKKKLGDTDIPVDV